MNDKVLTQKDLDLVKDPAATDKTSGGGSGADSADDKSKAKADSADSKADDKSAAGDKPAGDDKAKADEPKGSGSLLDGLDLDSDDDDEPAAKAADKKDAKDDGDKSKKSEESKAKDDDKDAKDADKKADKDKDADPDNAWRVALADRILKGQEDKLTAAKLVKARDSILKDLARFKTQEDYMLAGHSARQRIRSGDVKAGHPGADASPEELAAWRKANDVPEEASGYELPVIQGHKWEDEQPLVDAFFGAAHKANLTRTQVKELAAFQRQYGVQVEEEMEEKMIAQDREDRDVAHDDLRGRYGIPDFKPRMKALDRLLQDDELLPDGRGRKLMEARYYDPETKMWRRVMNDPYIAAMFISHAEYEYGDVGFTPTDTIARNKSRIAEIEELMNSDYDAYNRKGANGKSPADELLELRRAEEERKARGGRRRAA
jgi:hypothetical protein